MLRGYYFITDAALSRAGNYSDVKNAVAAGVCAVQYRNKLATIKQAFAEALELKALCKGVNFIVNDRLDLALAVDADGLHLGNDDLPYIVARRLLGNRKIIGVTVHNLKEAKVAAALGADYLGVSPIFPTGTKKDAGVPAGIKLIRQVKNNVKIPVVAIGGINLTKASKVIQAGADALCAISAVVTKPDVSKEISRFQKLFSSRKKYYK